WEVSDRGHHDRVTLDKPLIARQWYVISVSLDTSDRSVVLTQEPKDALLASDTYDSARHVFASLPSADIDEAPVVFAALPTGGTAPKYIDHYNGRIDSPIL